MIVLLFHFDEILVWGDIDLFSTAPFLAKSYLMVDCFFILSGFVLSYVYGRSLTFNAQVRFRDSSTKFLIARVARIYPLHIFTLGVMLLIRASSYAVLPQTDPFFRGKNDLSGLIMNIFLVQSWGFNDSLSWNQPSWSISTEAFAYLLFPLLCVAKQLVPKFFLAMLLFTPPIFYATLLHLGDNLDLTFHLGLMRCVAGFMLGLAAYEIWVNAKARAMQLLQISQSLVFVGIILSMHFNLNDILLVFLFFMLILSTANDEGLVARALSQPLLVHLGMISYSIYMLHYVVLHFAQQYRWFLFDYWVSNGFVEAQTLSLLIVVLLFFGILLVSEASYRIIEIPARQYLQKKLSQLGSGASASSIR